MIEHGEEAKTGHLAELIAGATSIVVFTGAGISTESGIADFRSPGGIWSKIKPIQFQDFLDHEEVRLEDWRRRFHFQPQFDNAPLNDGHRAVERIIANHRGRVLVTQNIDGLHQRSGIPPASIVELHGNGTRATCLDCKSPMTLDAAREIIGKTARAPRCQRCGGLVKANVVSFGQPMPRDRLADAESACRDCDLCLILGSSLVVQPAASLPVIARQSGAKLAIVNREATPLDHLADISLRSSIGATLQKALEKAGI